MFVRQRLLELSGPHARRGHRESLLREPHERVSTTSWESSGIDFNQETHPRYTDFAYFAFTVGMSYAVSDTNVGQSAIRRLVLQQALLSYLLGVVVIGATINLLVSLPG